MPSTEVNVKRDGHNIWVCLKCKGVMLIWAKVKMSAVKSGWLPIYKDKEAKETYGVRKWCICKDRHGRLFKWQ